MHGTLGTHSIISSMGEVPLLSATFHNAVHQQETYLQIKTDTLTPVRQNRAQIKGLNTVTGDVGTRILH